MSKISKVVSNIYNGAPIPEKIRAKLKQREKLHGNLSQNKPIIENRDDYKSGIGGLLDLSSRIPFARMWTAVNFRREDNETGEFTPLDDRELVIYQVNNGEVNDYNQTPATPEDNFISPTQQLTNNELMNPSAGIKNISSNGYGQGGIEGFVREVTVQFKVYNYPDFDRIYSRYFLTPGAHIFLDFGWGNTSKPLYDPKCFFSADSSCGGQWGTKDNAEEAILYHTARLMNESNGDLVIENGVVSKFDSSLNTDGSFSCSLTFISLNASLLENDQTADDPDGSLAKSMKQGIDNAVLLTIADVMDVDTDKIQDHALFNKDPNDEFSMTMQRMMALSVSADSYVDMETYYDKHEEVQRKATIKPGQSILEFCLDNGISADQLLQWNSGGQIQSDGGNAVSNIPKIFSNTCTSFANDQSSFGCINMGFTPQELYEKSNIKGGSHWKNRDGSDRGESDLYVTNPWQEEADIIFKIPKISSKSYDYGVYWKVFDPILGAGNKDIDDITQQDLGVDDEYWAQMKEQEILSAYIKSRVPSTSTNMYVSFKWFENFLNENLATIGEGGKYLTKFDFSMYQTDEEGNITAEKIPRTINYDESLFLHLSYISQHRETAFLYPTRDVFDKKFNGSVSLYDTFISVNMIRDAFETHSAIGDAITYILKKINAESMGIVKLTYSPGDNINSISISDVNHDIQTKTKETLPEPYLFSLNSPNTIVNSGELRSNLQNNDLKNLIAIQNSTGENKFFPLTESDLMHAATKGINITDKNHYYTWWPLKDTKKEEIKYKHQEDDSTSEKKYEYEDYQKRAIIKELSKAFNFKLTDSEQRQIYSLEGGKIKKAVYESTNLETVLNTTHTKAQEAETIATDADAKKYRENLFKKLLDPLKKEKNKELWKNGVFVIDSIETYFLHLIKKKVKTAQRPQILLPYDFSFKIYGIHGLEPGHEVMVDFLPQLYIDRCKFLIKTVNHDVSTGWKTTINTMMVFKSDADLNVPLTEVKSLWLSPESLFKMGYGTNQIQRIYDGNVEWYRLKPSPWDNSLSAELIEASFKKYTTEEPPKWIPDFQKYSKYEVDSDSYDIVYIDEKIPGYDTAYKIVGCFDPESENYFCARRPVGGIVNTAAKKYCESARYCPAGMNSEYCTDQIKNYTAYSCPCPDNVSNEECTCYTTYLVEHIHDLCSGCNDSESMSIAAAYEKGMLRPDITIGGYNQYKHAGRFYIPQDICEGSFCTTPNSCPASYPSLAEGIPSGQCTENWWKIAFTGLLGNVPELTVAREQESNSDCNMASYWDGECTYDAHWKTGPHWFGRGEGNECNSPTYCPGVDGGTEPCRARFKMVGEGEEATIEHTTDGDGMPWGSGNDGCYHWPWYLGDRPWSVSCGSYGKQLRDNPNTDANEEGEITKMDNSCCTYASTDECAIMKEITVNGEKHIADVTPYYCDRCYQDCDGGNWYTNCSVHECVHDVGFVRSDYRTDGVKFGHYPYDNTYGAHLEGRKSGHKGNLCIGYDSWGLIAGVGCYANPYCCNMYCDQEEPWWWQSWPTKAPASAPRAWPPYYICDSDYKIEQDDYDNAETPGEECWNC